MTVFLICSDPIKNVVYNYSYEILLCEESHFSVPLRPGYTDALSKRAIPGGGLFYIVTFSFSNNLHRLHVDGKRKRNNNITFSNENASFYVRAARRSHFLERVTGVQHFSGPVFEHFVCSRSRFSNFLSAQGPIFKFLSILGRNFSILLF